MQIIHINSINPKLKYFLFESRKMVLKYPSLDFNFRCYTKILDASYQYYTIIPDAVCEEIPFDILTRYINNNKFLSYVLIGDYVYVEENNELYRKMIVDSKLEENHIEGSAFAKLKLLSDYYDTDKIDEDIKYKILALKDRFDLETDSSSISRFNATYYQYYRAIENARKQKIDCTLLSEGVNKIYTR